MGARWPVSWNVLIEWSICDIDVVHTCGAKPPVIDNTEVELRWKDFQLHAIYQCLDGFENSRHLQSFILKCQDDNQWEEIILPKCNGETYNNLQGLNTGYLWHSSSPEINCGPPPVVPNAYSSQRESFINAILQYKCMDGYHFLDGSSETSTQCLSNQEWSHIPSGCQGEHLSILSPWWNNDPLIHWVALFTISWMWGSSYDQGCTRNKG